MNYPSDTSDAELVRYAQEGRRLALERSVSLVAIQNALRNLDPLTRDVVIPRFLLGLGVRDVSVILDKTVPTIKVLQHQGLKDLRKILGEA